MLCVTVCATWFLVYACLHVVSSGVTVLTLYDVWSRGGGSDLVCFVVYGDGVYEEVFVSVFDSEFYFVLV